MSFLITHGTNVAILLFFINLLGLTNVEARRVKQGYKDSFTFATFRNTLSGEERTVCANYLQYRDRFLPEEKEKADYYSFRWWQDKLANTKVCSTPSPGTFNYSQGIVPLDYRITPDETNCSKQFSGNDFRNAAQYEVDQLKVNNAGAGLLLLDKGRQFVARWRDFLFSDFYDPYINATTAIPTFFLYRESLQSTLKELNAEDGSSIQIGFHRPQDSFFDVSMLVIWLLAMGCVTGGGLWAFHRHKLGKDKPTLPHHQATESSTQTADSTTETVSEKGCCARFCTKYANAVAIIVLMAFLVAVLMTGFFFRSALVGLFNVLVTILGSISVFHCVRALLSNFSCLTDRRFYKAKPPMPERFRNWVPSPPSYLDVCMYILSLAMCVYWYFTRKGPYAFILLDIINVTLCLHILKSLRLPSVKWISCLMACMFIYDAFMVFVTPSFTKNGCSVMLEVATGIDCSSNSAQGYPMPPIDASQPEKFPMLMQVMPFDSMTECMDLEVETGYPMTILGLGDIIIPGYLVTHCFTMSGFPERIRLLYGFVCVIGYGVGLIVTFMALTFMHMAQPALIYLVPCTLIPIYVLALCRKEFCKLWSGGKDDEKVATISDTETVHLSSDESNASPISEV